MAPRFSWRFVSSAEKNSASRHGCRLQGRHDHERGAAVREQARDGLGSLDETVVHRLEQDEELRDVRQELRSQDPVGHLVEGSRREVDQPRPVGHDQPAQQARREEVGHALRRIEKVERVARRRRVDDDQVVLTLGVDLVEPLHRDVVVRLHEARRDVLVQRVGQDLLAGLLVGRMRADEIVPALLRVQHRRPQLAPRVAPRLGEHVVGDADLVVPDPLQPQRVGQPTGRVDRQHQDAAALFDHGGGGQRGGRRGLAHPSGSAGDDDVLGRQQVPHRLGRRRTGRGHSPSSSPSAWATWRVVRAPKLRANR